ncbi:MAG: hypothetical protein HBSAPP03_04980 [Phycisphaerae bacterium]|nr:MAG: hypothetical protein HBSAPP03_04980 [Phycisphaerae bacterium]
MSISSTVRRIQDIMRKDPGVDGDAQRVAQLAWIIFLKVFDSYEQSAGTSVLPSALQWSTWTKEHHDVTGDRLIRFVNDHLFPGLRSLKPSSDRATLVSQAFQETTNYMRSGSLLREVIGLLEREVDFDPSGARFVIGDIYEKMLGDLQSAGNAGEFYTPRPIVDFAVEMVNPKAGERFLDFACGVGGFLVSGLKRMSEGTSPGSAAFRRALLGVSGVEKKALPHFLCITNLLLHGLDRPGAVSLDNLLTRQIHSFSSGDKVDVICTNPPFGGAEEEAVYQKFPDGLRSRETADLFVLLMMHLLRDGGRAAVVLPDGFLFGAGAKARIRQLLLSTCDVHTIVRIPKGAFNPYTGIATNILFLTKGRPTDHVWYYEHKYPVGQGSYSKTRPLRAEEFDPIRRWWTDRQETESAWLVERKALEACSLNLDQRNPFVERKRKINPTARVRKYHRLREDISQKCQSLRTALVDSFATDRLPILLDHLELMVSDSVGISSLRELVLSLAMSGHVKSGGPAIGEWPGELLAIDSVSPKTRSGLPKHWRVMRLDQLGEIVGGSTPSASDESNFAEEGGVPWLTPSDLYGHRSKWIDRGRRNLTQKGLSSCSAKVIPKGSVLFSTRAPIGYVAMAANPLSTNQGFKSVVPKVKEMSEFIYYFLLAERKLIESRASGTTFKEVPSRDMRAITVPVPPLVEQQTIVATLDRLMALCDDLEIAANESRSEHAALIENLAGYVGAR